MAFDLANWHSAASHYAGSKRGEQE